MGETERPTAAVDGRREPIRVLHVDDDPAFAELTATYLSERHGGFDIETARDADEAQQQLAELTVDCVVSDYEMPGRDGIEFLRSVRAEYPGLPFILFTGKGSEAVASEAMNAGVTDYLQKEGGTDQYTVLANRIEQAVSERRARRNYRELFEKIGDGVKIESPETGEIVDVNRQFCEMHGYEREELLGVGVDEYTHESVSEAETLERIEQAAQGDSVVFESVNEASDGEPIPVEVQLTGTQIDGQDRVLGVVRDISERKQRARRLEKATDRTELALSGSNSWLWEWELETNTVIQSAVSGLVDADNGRTERPISEFIEQIHPGDRESFLAGPDEAIEGGGDYHAEFRLLDAADAGDADGSAGAGGPESESGLEGPAGGRSPVASDSDRNVCDSDVRWIESRGEFYPGGPDKPDRIIGIATDITERKHRERQRQWMRDLLDLAGEGVFLSDPDTAAIQYANDTACRTLGYDREQLLELSILDIQPQLPDQTAWAEHVAWLRESEESRLYEGEHVRADSSTFPVEIRSGITNIDGDEYVFGVVRDVTHRVERERKLERQNERLESFARTVSHDLRSPLNVAAGRLELARETGDPEEFDRIAAALGRMDERIEELLALARKGRTVEEFEPVDLGALARQAWESVETGEAELIVDTDQTVLADAGRLTEVFENLYRNAVEHGSTGSRPGADDAVEHGSTSPPSHTSEDAVEHGSTSSQPSADDAVEHGSAEGAGAGSDRPLRIRVGALGEGFCVEDDGPGVPEGERSRLFEPGYTTDPDGTGFGLAIVEQIARAHGWTVVVGEGELGGARFVFSGVETPVES